MSSSPDFTLRPVGYIRSELRHRADAPKQNFEGAPDAWLEISPAFGNAVQGLVEGQDIILITWFHAATRDRLAVHPRGDPEIPLAGVFATRSPDRPNPLGLHRVTLRKIERLRLRVGPIEAIDGTPVVDLKPVLPESKDS
jgi:tRNA-Thr(GGU) m(6)t(6)A37 methyltransferase TsaA